MKVGKTVEIVMLITLHILGQDPPAPHILSGGAAEVRTYRNSTTTLVFVANLGDKAAKVDTKALEVLKTDLQPQR